MGLQLKPLFPYTRCFDPITRLSWSEYDDGSGNPCGHDGAQDDNSWYMSYSPCYRANAAYSLFGILKGEEDTGCNRKTFINSFFTTAGVESFTQAMGYTGKIFSSGSNDDDYYAGGVSAYTCEAAAVDEGDDANNSNWMHGWRLNQGYKSFGIGCSNGEYAKMSFPGAHCTKSATAKVTQELDTFNSEMSKIECQAIYQDGASVAVQNNDGNNGDDDNANDNNNNGDDGGSAMDLLTNSESCNVLEYPRACPDPFGKLVKYNRQLEDSTGVVHNKRKERLRKILSWFMFIVGALMIASAIMAWLEERKERRAKNQQQQKTYKNNRRAERQAEREREQQAYERQQQQNENQRARSRSRERSRASNNNDNSSRKGNRFTRWFRRNKN